MARTILIFCWLLFAVHSCAQSMADTGLRPRWTKPGPIAALYPDHFGNVWMLTRANALLKYSARGDSLGVYNAIARHGWLHQLSISNPLQPVLFYKDFQTIVLLDRMLSPQTTLPLFKANLFQVQSACLSYDGHLWVYDELENKLVKLNQQGQRLLETSDFRQLLSHPFSPQYLADENGNVCAYDAAYGWVIFDYYGAVKKELAYPGWMQPDASKQGVSGLWKGAFVQLPFANLLMTTQPLLLPDGCTHFSRMDASLFCLDAAGNLSVY